MPVSADSWLSAVIGQPVFKVSLPAGHEDWEEELRAHLKSQGAAFYYAKIGTEHVEVLRRLTRLGAYLVDVNVTFGWTGSIPGESGPEDVVVRACEEQDVAAVLDVA